MISLDVTGLDKVASYFEGAPERANKAASLALNQTGDRVIVPRSRDLIEEQINFPKGYVNSDRLFVAQRASPSRLEVKIRGRDRPTSLLRFSAIGARRGGTTTIASTTVHPGNVRAVRRGFVVNLKSGNQGYALRLRPGETINNRRLTAVSFGRGLVLLYGPSVNQAFLDIADKLTPLFLDSLTDEFYRQFARDNL